MLFGVASGMLLLFCCRCFDARCFGGSLGLWVRRELIALVYVVIWGGWDWCVFLV